MKLKNKKVLVYGLGDSGRSALKLLKNHRADVSFFDDDIKYYEYVGFERNPQDKQYDLVVVSPGVKCLNNPLLEIFRQKNIEIISEIDLAYLFSRGKIIAITGTNGKTTTCMLVNQILRTAGYNTFLCGNIGLPFSSICEKTNKHSVTVCEVSNFQLETSKYFRADISAVLNVRPDHLDRHGTFEEYFATKKKIAQNLKKRDLLILNFDDENSKKMILHKKYQFFSKKMLKNGVFVKKNQIFVKRKSILSLNEINLLGEKNLENVLASVAICSHFKVSNQNFSKAISSFRPASHRTEIVGCENGVTFVDDSKATNVASTIACVETFKNKDIILLMGGQGKDIDYGELFCKNFKFRKVICFGADRKNIFRNAQLFGYDCDEFPHFDDAVIFAKEVAKSGEYVLLSPACSSFDEFSSYAQRGERFKELILSQKREAGDV